MTSIRAPVAMPLATVVRRWADADTVPVVVPPTIVRSRLVKNDM